MDICKFDRTVTIEGRKFRVRIMMRDQYKTYYFQIYKQCQDLDGTRFWAEDSRGLEAEVPIDTIAQMLIMLDFQLRSDTAEQPASTSTVRIETEG